MNQVKRIMKHNWQKRINLLLAQTKDFRNKFKNLKRNLTQQIMMKACFKKQ